MQGDMHAQPLANATLLLPGRRGERPSTRLPSWIRAKAPSGESYTRIKAALRTRGLHTVCEEARCPNLAECWGGGDGGHGTATLMLMGGTCTRGCGFCAVGHGRPEALDPDEPRKASETVGIMGVAYVVLTSVNRDDLPDGGAAHFAATVERLRRDHADLRVEVLIPDFQGNAQALGTLVAAKPDVVAHNIETVRRLTPLVRDRRAHYDQSLELLRRVKEIDPTRFTKSSIMVGHGETDEEVVDTMADLAASGVDIVTLGQYLRPSASHLPVRRYIEPAAYATYEREARRLGFLYCFAGPLVRSSYKAGEAFLAAALREGRGPRAVPSSGDCLPF